LTLHDFGFLGPIPQQHGTKASYSAGCHCLPCRAAASSYELRRRRARAAGIPAWVDASAARTHLLALQAKGVGYMRAARLAGISGRTVVAVRSGKQGRITVETERAILGITKPSLAPGTHVNGYDARRKLRTLLAEGFTVEGLARVLRLHPDTVAGNSQVIPEDEYGRQRLPQEPRMRVSTVLRVRAFFARVTAEQHDSSRPEV
jgi:hypothetical protein